MKLAIISDTHFGDPNSILVESTDESSQSTKYNEFLNAVGQDNDYLILLGDILDFSIAGYAGAYEVAKKFFYRIRKDNVAREIIYIAGNHDADIWHMVEHQVNVINRVSKGKLPRPFRMAVPGVLDDRKDAKEHFTLIGVDPSSDEPPRYGGLFFDSITKDSDDPTATPMCFNFAYPNCYFVTDDETILLTHGQYFESYWSLLGEYAIRIFGEDLHLGDTFDIHEWASLNFPQNQLACTGIGQSGPLKDLACRIQRDKKDGEFHSIEEYVKQSLDVFMPRFVVWPFRPLLRSYLQYRILKKLQKQPSARFNEQFFDEPAVAERIKNYVQSCFFELEMVNAHYDIKIDRPSTVLCGHTHEPIALDDSTINKQFPLKDGSKIRILNSGGWLTKKDRDSSDKFVGAAVFKYESGKRLESVLIE